MGDNRDELEHLQALVRERDAELEHLRSENEELRSVIAQLSARVTELEARLSQNPRNSSVPPSLEGLRKPPLPPNRAARRRRPGKQPGDPGHRLVPVGQPDSTVEHVPERCERCGADLCSAEVLGHEVRQVFDLPELRPLVTEHRAERRRCRCGAVSTGGFPSEATAPTCYGPGVRALLTYLVCGQHLPIERATEVLEECSGITVSTGFAASLITEAGEGLTGFTEAVGDALRQSPVLHVDETGARVAGRLGWVHSASTARLTSYLFHRRRGRVAIEEFKILPGYSGIAVHDGFVPYRGYHATHSLCNAHHLRELQAVVEEGQSWAGELIALLVETHETVFAAKNAQKSALSVHALRSLKGRYDALIQTGLLANPPPLRTGKRGRPSRTKTANLLDRLDRYRDDVLRFATDFSAPFDNNQAERDLRMVKLQQKISGCFRTETGASNYLAIRSYVSTVRKQGINVFGALRDLFEGKPFLPEVAGA